MAQLLLVHLQVFAGKIQGERDGNLFAGAGKEQKTTKMCSTVYIRHRVDAVFAGALPGFNLTCLRHPKYTTVPWKLIKSYSPGENLCQTGGNTRRGNGGKVGTTAGVVCVCVCVWHLIRRWEGGGKLKCSIRDGALDCRCANAL